MAKAEHAATKHHHCHCADWDAFEATVGPTIVRRIVEVGETLGGDGGGRWCCDVDQGRGAGRATPTAVLKGIG